MTRAALWLQGWWLIWPPNSLEIISGSRYDFQGVDHEGHQTFQLKVY